MTSFVSLPPPPGENFYQDSVDVLLTTPDIYLETKDFARFNLYSDSTTAMDRQILLAPTDLEGQQITLILQSGDSTTCLLSTASTPYVRIEGAWTPSQYDQITLQWSKGLWIEITRSASSGGGFNPDITNPQPGDIIIYSGTAWENHPVSGEFTLSATGDMEFKYVSAPTTGQVLTYDGTHWINAANAGPGPITFVPVPAAGTWTSNATVGKVGTAFAFLNGTFTTPDGANTAMGTLPPGYGITGTIYTTASYTSSGQGGISVVPIVINGSSVTPVPGTTLFAGDTFRVDATCYPLI